MSAQYPGAAGTDANLFVAANNLSTSLSDNPLSSGATTVNVASTTGFPTAGYITIDAEAISYTGVTGTSFTGCTRGADGTTAASHVTATSVFHDVVAAHHNVLKDEIKAIETDLVAGMAALTPVTAASTAGSILIRLEHIISQIKNGFGLTNWYDAVTAMLPKSGGTMSGDLDMGSSNVKNFPLTAYRRPVLQWVSATTIQIEAGIDGTANEVKIVFPDGTMRTDSTALHVLLTTTRVAALSGTKQSGMRSGSVATQTWYAVYAVKATDNSTDFVAVMDTTLPLQANFATLNSNFGTNGWVYLGLIRNGDGGSLTTNIIKFTMVGNETTFLVATSGHNVGVQGPGLLLATTASAANLTYTYSAGTAGAVIPNNIAICTYVVSHAPPTAGQTNVFDAAVTQYGAVTYTNATYAKQKIRWAASLGVKVAPPSSVAQDIALEGFTDTALGIGSNPLL